MTPGVFCTFCNKPFGSKLTLGRHLDSRIGDLQHPEEDIRRLRSNVIRRGEKRDVTKLKTRRQQVSRDYNNKLEVREKNKLRRKKRDQRIGARLKATDWYLAKFQPPGGANLPEDVSFPGMVATHLLPSQWPPDKEVPGQKQMDHLLGRIDEVLNVDLNRLYKVFSDWKCLDVNELREQWANEVWLAVRKHLGETSLGEVSGAWRLVEQKQEEILAGSSDVLNMKLD